tara:strand:- start:7 stop:255 length:249 start_codon:yes stop_codon:yes gene_type:complete
VKLSPEEKLKRYLKRKYMRSLIEKEMGTIYVYKDKKFLTKQEAIEYKTLTEHVKNEKELDLEWKKSLSKKKTKLIKDLWKEA